MCAGARELRAPAPGKPQRPDNRSARKTAAPGKPQRPREYSDAKHIDKPARVFGRQTYRQTRTDILASNTSTTPRGILISAVIRLCAVPLTPGTFCARPFPKPGKNELLVSAR